MDATFNKAARIQKQLDVVEGDNQQLQAKVNKLEAQKKTVTLSYARKGGYVAQRHRSIGQSPERDYEIQKNQEVFTMRKSSLPDIRARNY